MARSSARPRDAGRTAGRRVDVEPDRSKKLTTTEHELPDGRYLLAYGYRPRARSHA
jgi:hypothetical protein